MKQMKRAMTVFVLFTLLFLCAGVFRLLANGRDFMNGASILVSCALILLWAASVRWRVIERRHRALWIAVAGMFVLYYALLNCNYTFFLHSGAVYERVCALYYIPLTLLPLFVFYAMLSVTGLSRRAERTVVFVTAPAALLLIAGFLTDGLHGLAFPGGINGGIGTRGPLYWIFIVWFALLVGSGLLLPLFRFERSRRFARLAAVLPPLALGLVLAILFFTGNNPKINNVWVWNNGDLLAFPAICYFELCIQTGLVPSNRAYGRLLSQKALRLQIADAAGTVQLSSEGYPAAELPAQLERRHFPIRGGSVTYLSDLTQIQQLTAEISDTVDAVRQRNEYLETENRRLEQQHAPEAKNEIYSRIAEAVRPQTEAICALDADAVENEIRPLLIRSAVCGVYIKRRSNLELLSADAEELPAAELLLALRESAEYLSLAGIRTSVQLPREFTVSAALMTEAYAVFEQFAEQCLGKRGMLSVSVSGDPLCLKLRLLCRIPELEWTVPSDCGGALRRTTVREDEGGDSYITVTLRKGGDAE